jgi:hypothetical protein
VDGETGFLSDKGLYAFLCGYLKNNHTLNLIFPELSCPIFEAAICNRIAVISSTGGNLMNNIVYIVGAVVIVLAILSFLGFR